MKFAVPQVLQDPGVLLSLSLCLSLCLCVPVSMAPFISKMAATFSGTHAEETAVSKEQRLFLLGCHFLLGRKSILRRPQQICPQDAAARSEPHSIPLHQGSWNNLQYFCPPLEGASATRGQGSAVCRDQGIISDLWKPHLGLGCVRSPIFGS